MADKKNVKESDPQTAESAGAWIKMYFRHYDGKPLNLTNVKARASELCGQKDEGCWQDLGEPTDRGTTFKVAPNQDVLIDAKGEVSGNPWSFYPALVSVDCGKTAEANMIARQHRAPSPQTDKTTLALNAHRCVSRDDHRERTGAVKIIRAAAERMPPAHVDSDKNDAMKPVVLPATILDDYNALFSLQQNLNYLIYLELEEECARPCPAFPFSWYADEDKEISICVEPRERVVSVLMVDPCGKAVDPTGVLVEHGGRTQPLPAGQAGTYTLTGVDVGRVRLLSQSYRFTPHEILVDDRMNQAHVLEATKLPVLADSEDLDELLLEFADEIKQGEEALFKILTLEGKLIETLEVGRGKRTRYLARPDQT